MTDTERIAEIREREQSATPGPWRVRAGNVYHPTNVATDEAEPWTMCEIIPGCNGLELPEGEEDAGNAQFIASARTDIPYLLDRVVALERERDKAQNEASHFRVRWAEDKERLEKENQALHDALKKWGIYLAFDGGAGVEEE